MKQLSTESVKQWRTMGNTWSIPASIGTTCPHCTSVVIFTMIEDGLDNNHRAYLCSGICPSCVEKSEFIFLAPKIRDDVNPKTTEIYITPTPTDWHQTIEFTENISSALRRAYESTVDSFNSKNYVATAVGCRRTLEGIFKNLVQDDKKSLTLSKMIDEVKDSVDLAAPLTKLSHAIRAGGNLGAHFDENLEPSREMANHMVELVEYMLTYLYVLPDKINGLDDVLGNKP